MSKDIGDNFKRNMDRECIIINDCEGTEKCNSLQSPSKLKVLSLQFTIIILR